MVSTIPVNNTGGKLMANGTSIDDVTAQRFDSYYCDAWADAPVSGNNNGTVIVIPRAVYGSNLYQVYLSTGIAAGIYIRSRVSNGTYSSWYRLSLTAVS